MPDSIQNSSSLEAATEPPEQNLSPEELAKSDLWIFREGRREFSGSEFLGELQRRIAGKDSTLDCLIQAGELEAALADLNSPAAGTAAELTDALASRLCNETDGGDRDPAQIAEQITVPGTISVSPPEGFTYYALHPLDFARLAEKVTDRAANFAVIGIRSIGTTLSAVVTAALKSRGKTASRTTVRPSGHPYSRNAEFSAEQQKWIEKQNTQSALFVVVDEGPGRSGSTFLSVGEALLRAGVAASRIVTLGSRAFDPASLCAQAAAERWRSFEFLSAASSTSARFAQWTYLGGGDWRAHFCGGENTWPESWTQMERFKVLSRDRREFVKFEGMGRIGHEARLRAYALAEHGFSPVVTDAGGGFLSYAAIQGRCLEPSEVTRDLLEKMARYCAFRVAEFRDHRSADGELEQMLSFNVNEEFGRELDLVPGQLAVDEKVIVDGRMQPYEWIVSENGGIWKTDAISHGDNHFFPGPCGIGWDLAGIVVEWGLGSEERDFLVEVFRKFSGHDARGNLPAYMLAYNIFRMGFCKMARSTVRGSSEEVRLTSAYLRYREKAAQLLGSTGISAVA